jgi:cytidyltransferase-like protein
MNNFTKLLVNDLLEQKDQKITAIYGGSFKPPTKGHFNVVKKAAEQNPEIDDLIIYVGSGIRDNISQAESIQIWDLYKKYLPLKTRIEPVKSPIGDILRYAKEHPEETVLWVIGARENNPEDWADISSRTRTLDKYPNIQLRVIQTQGGVSGTAARKAVKDNNKEQFFNLIPDIEEKEQVWDIVSPIVQEGLSDTSPKAVKFWALYYNIFQALKPNPEERYNTLSQKLKGEHKEALDYFYNEFFKDGKSLDEASDPQAGTALPYGSGFSPLKEAWNLQDAFVTLSQYMIDNGMNIQPLPKIKVIKDDEENASDLLGKTAYYNPSEKSITLYTMDRHPKDILRSFAHEMVHHEQNLESRINNINTTNTNEDGDLPEIEKEAYEKGNMMLRNWEDSIKNS